ncbi:oxidoreductase domain protein [Isosphaera pallida ATCC 43644]|uniref:Oxidoreductase domain protein n=1 Tax=Isosphaera pallida (strain ATCC 43644 / DSM 9630 / IS1B) TaxID=575540 RepID=E8R1S1_ISOPI|nr:Gfo/Idh/MocA family oxidoreductase [Isosphaera pallida]ADV61343.1 oxidoreductase domain protein [Isosphaera pallida ATCC 43644]
MTSRSRVHNGRLRAAVVGVGHLGRHHARILGGMPDVELVAVVDTRIEQAREIAQARGPLVQAYSEIGPLLEPEARLDAVVVAVPTMLHHDVAIEFLRRGISCLVEKPLAAELGHAVALVNAARAGGAVLHVGHIERYNPVFEALQLTGFRPRVLMAERRGSTNFRCLDVGVVLDLMIHDLDLILALVPSEPKTVHAVGLNVLGGHEDEAMAHVEFEDGTVAILTASRISDTTARTMRVWGDEGCVSIDFAARSGATLRPTESTRRGLDLDGLDRSRPETLRNHLFGKVLRIDPVHRDDGSNAPALAGPKQPRLGVANFPSTMPTQREPLAIELEDFISAVVRGTSPRCSGLDALRAMRLADQILRAIHSHRWTDPNSSEPIMGTLRPRPVEREAAWL